MNQQLWIKKRKPSKTSEVVFANTATSLLSSPRLGKGAAYDAQKKKLPMAMFCCTFDENSNKTVEASNVELHISVKSDNNENRLVIKFRR